ncbi:hypothetical protein INT45_002755 [Circinella minor]|uniref:Uncharacterized protein n=1 Tax=Circinella minor TaxID=1195481 RepID=A0A8H7RYL4_9FUNG|nr:hypothetical protein INT45_002755 [Circinella minor]
MSTIILHQYDLPLKQYENNIVDKHFDIKSPFQTTNTTTLPTLIVKSDSESDTTTIIDDEDDEDNNNNNSSSSIVLNQKDDSSITETTTSSDITLSQEDDIPGTSVPNTPTTSLSSSQSSKIPTTTMESDNNQLLSELTFSSKTDEQVNHLYIDVSKTTTPIVKLHNLKSRFKQVLGLSHNHKKHRRTRRHCVDFEQHYPSHSTKQNNTLYIEKERKKDNENIIIDNNKNNQYTEQYRESMDLPVPTWHLEHYHPASPVPTLSYSICGPGRYQHHLQQGVKQSQNQQKKLPQQPIIPPSPFPTSTPTKMPVKGILKKQSKFPLPEEQDQQCNIESNSSSLKLSSSATVIEKREQHHHLSVEENNKSTTSNSAFKSRSWLHKLKNTMISYNPSSSTQQQTNNANTKNKNGETEERKQRKRTIRYNKMVIVHETYTPQEYNREPDPNISCIFLTAEEAQDIKNELNMYKFNEMIVHPNSRIYTHFFI